MLDAKIALQTDQTRLKALDLRQKLIALDAELSLLRQHQSNTERACAQETADAQKLGTLLTADNLPIPPALEVFITESAPRDTQSIRDLQSAFTSLALDFSRQHTLLTEQASTLKSEDAQLEDEIRKLRTGDRETSYESEVPQASRLRRLLRAELELASQEVVFLCTVLDIPNPEWQDSGKTRISLAIAALLSQKMTVQTFKVGKDYIDPSFSPGLPAVPAATLTLL